MTTSPSEIVQVLIAKAKKPEESFLFRQYQKLMSLPINTKIKVTINADNPQDSTVVELLERKA